MILEREDVAAFDETTCALFLRNLVTQLGQPDLTDYVEAGAGAAASDESGADFPRCSEVAAWRVRLHVPGARGHPRGPATSLARGRGRVSFPR